MRDHLHIPGFGSATLASHIPTHETRARDRDTIAGAMAICETAGSLLKEQGDRIAALEAENARLREALAFYADPVTYETSFDRQYGCFAPNNDGGRKARAVLAAKEQAK